MFVKTIKIKNLGYIIGAVAVIAVIIAVAVASGGKNDTHTFAMSTNEERVGFLRDLGWETSDSFVDSKAVVIPSDFDDVYSAYNKLQKEQGFDLSDYKGKTAEIFTYEIYNYPDCDKQVVANMIILDNKLIGGDVCCTDIEGFMQGFIMPTTDIGEKPQENSQSSGLSKADNSDTQHENQHAVVDDTSSQQSNDSENEIIRSDTIE